MKETLRTWEFRLAVGALGLLTLQAMHEILMYFLGDSPIGGLVPLAIVLLPFTIGILAGLLRGGRIGLWCGVVLAGSLGLALLASFGPSIYEAWPHQLTGLERISTVYKY